MSRVQKSMVAAVAALMLGLMLLIVFGDQGLLEMLRLRNRQQTLTDQNEVLARENVNLYRTISRLKSDPLYIESVARRELGMVGKDDLVVIRSGGAGLRR